MPIRQKAKREGLKMQKKEDKIQDAVVGIQSGRFKNPREAADELGIPKQASTIRRRLNGTSRPRIESQIDRQLLTPVTEGVLVDWIKFYDFAGIPLSKKTMYAKVTTLCGQTPGKDWLFSFLRRHPDCAPGRPSGLDPKRATAFNRTNVKAHFDLLQKEFANGGNPIPARNIYNMDEVGIQRGGGRKNSGELFLFSSSDKARYKLTSDDLELTTILECVCLDGSSTIPSGFVFAGSLMCPAWFEVRDDLVIGTTDTGWTNAVFFQTWFSKGFIPAAKAHSDPNFPIFLLLDGHNSHDTVESVDEAIANNVKIGQMGSHQTHKEQPCDVGAFGPSKNNWRIRCDEVLHETGEDIPVSDIVKKWMFVREKSFKVETIKQAWFKSGINLDASGLFPRLTPDIFTDADFAPSISTSTQLHLPATFPPLPSSEGDDRDSLSPAGKASGAASGSSSSSAASTSASAAASTSASASTSSSLPFSLPTLSYEYPDSDDDEPPSDLEGPALLEFYRAAAVKAKAQRNEARAQREGADAHAVMAGLHAQSLQQKLAAKGKKRSGNDRTLSTKARMLTSAEGRELAEQRRTAQIDKQTKQDDNRTQKLLADAEVIKRRAELGRAGMEFTGTIKQLKLPQLKDLAWSLELEESGTREVLIERILAHFAENEELKKDKRYLELWTRRRRAAGASAEEPQDPQPLMDIQNTAGGSSQMDVDIPPPDAQYSFPDDWIPLHSSTSSPSPAPGFTWIPPPSHHPYNPQTGQPPPFSPAFYGNLPPSDFSSARHPYGRF